MKPDRKSRGHAIGRHAFIARNDGVDQVTVCGKGHHHLDTARADASDSRSEGTKHGIASRVRLRSRGHVSPRAIHVGDSGDPSKGPFAGATSHRDTSKGARSVLDAVELIRVGRIAADRCGCLKGHTKDLDLVLALYTPASKR
eukprot:4665889-Amphidinium_carterae.1